MKGTVADLSNLASKRKAGTITAAAFLEEFVGETPWAHVDIAGTAWDVGREYTGNDASGYGVRLLVDVAAADVGSAGRPDRRAVSEEEAMSSRQLLPLSGVASVLLIFVSFLIAGEPPDVDALARASSSPTTRRRLDLQIARGAARPRLLLLPASSAPRSRRRCAAARDRDAGTAAAKVSFAGGIVFTVGLTIFAGLAFTAGRSGRRGRRRARCRPSTRSK